jgi:hypothetical protein
MLYIDLILSFILFVMGLLSIFLRTFKPNPWLAALSLLFFPIAVIGYYFPDMNRTLFGTVRVLDVLLFPVVKILLLVSLFSFVLGEKR